MATVIIRPVSDYYAYYFTNLAQSENTNLYSNIDEIVLDTGDGIKGVLDSGYSYAFFNWSSTNLDAGSTINKITLCSDFTFQDDASLAASIGNDTNNLNNNNYYSLYQVFGATSASIVVNVNPQTSNSWTVSEVNSLVSGFRCDYGKTKVNIYRAYIEVDYTEPLSGTTHEGEATLSSLSYLRTKKS